MAIRSLFADRPGRSYASFPRVDFHCSWQSEKSGGNVSGSLDGFVLLGKRLRCELSTAISRELAFFGDQRLFVEFGRIRFVARL